MPGLKRPEKDAVSDGDDDVDDVSARGFVEKRASIAPKRAAFPIFLFRIFSLSRGRAESKLVARTRHSFPK